MTFVYFIYSLEVLYNSYCSKLQLLLQLLCGGLDQLDWTSVTFPDFIAKSRAVVCVDLQSTLHEVHRHMMSVGACVEAWSRVGGLDVFVAGENRTELKYLERKNRYEILEVHIIMAGIIILMLINFRT